ncbi:MAG: tetratricopeptide repeat protein [Armatimonadota bacterium]|nr:tetratricopeptide repeat protein [Armatimonadota bacterium]
MKLCDKCFSVIEKDSTFCNECGAPFDESESATSDSIVYPEIARSNLLRLRGDLAQAEKVCLAVLKRFPNNPAAHGMMGDLAFEGGKLDTAKQWYEMALDLTPNDEGLRRKLSAVVESTKQRDGEAGLAGLELKPRPGATIAAMIGVVALILAMGGLMFWLGYANKKTRADVIDPISINGEAPPRTSPITTPEEPVKIEPTENPEPRPGIGIAMTAEEAAARTAMGAELGALGARVGGIVLDPSGAVATVNGADSDLMDAAQVGAWLVRRGSQQAYVRIVDPTARSVRFSGTVTKAALEAATADPGSPEWAAAVLGSG